MRTLRQQILVATEVRVLLDPDYFRDNVHVIPVKIAKGEALKLLDRCVDHPPNAGLDAQGVLTLWPRGEY